MFFGSHLYNVSWASVFKEAAPMLPSERRKFILVVAGTSTINPMLILTSLIIDNKIGTSRSDTVFRQDVKSFAEEILNQYMESSQIPNANANNGPFILLKVLGSDYAKMQRFLLVYDGLKKEVDKMQGGNAPDNQDSNQRLSHRAKERWQEPTEMMILPFPLGECWNIGMYV